MLVRKLIANMSGVKKKRVGRVRRLSCPSDGGGGKRHTQSWSEEGRRRRIRATGDSRWVGHGVGLSDVRWMARATEWEPNAWRTGGQRWWRALDTFWAVRKGGGRCWRFARAAVMR